MWICLTNTDRQQVFVNMERVDKMARQIGDRAIEIQQTVLHQASGCEFVLETPLTILKRLKDKIAESDT